MEYASQEDSMRNVEDILSAEQYSIRNLTTFRVYPFPSRLVEVPFPLDASGQVFEPALLQMHSRSHTFMMPKCFHGQETRLVVVRKTSDSKEDTVNIICGEHNERDRCQFRVDVGRLFANGGPLTCTRYPVDPTKSESSFDSSSESSHPRSTSSLESARKRPRPSTPYPLEIADPKVETGEDFLTDVLFDYKTSSDILPNTDVLCDPLKPYILAPPVVVKEEIKLAIQPSGTDDRFAKLALKDAPGTEKHKTGCRDPRPIHLNVRRAKAADTVTNSYDDDAYPLLARGDGTSSIIRCIDPITHDFSHALFLAQIIKDANSCNGRKLSIFCV